MPSVTSCVKVRVPLASPTRTQIAFNDMLLKLALTGADGREERESNFKGAHEHNYDCNCTTARSSDGCYKMPESRGQKQNRIP